MATHSSILAWKIPQTEEPGGLQSMWMQRVRLSHFIGDCPGEQTPGLKTKFLQQSPCFLLKKTLSLSPNTLIIFPGERISV